MTNEEFIEERFGSDDRILNFDKIMTKTEIAVKNEDYALFCEVRERFGVSAERIMRNCLTDWAYVTRTRFTYDDQLRYERREEVRKEGM